jgi:hypothetical protein
VATKESVDAPWSPRALRRFLITFAIVATILLSPWPRWGRVFSGAFAGYANVVVGFFAIGGVNEPRFIGPTSADRLRPDVGEWTVLLVPGDGERTEAVPLDTRILGYTPFAIFGALVLSTPVTRRRRLKILVSGGALLLARLAIAVALPVGRSLGPVGPPWAFGPIAETIWFAFITPPATSYVTAALAWWIPLALTTRPGHQASKRDRSKPARRNLRGSLRQG